jgi:2-polyprenyl-3-methyl-5-hydroxy-6-metoxy-1,4-benzoquinol methylase
MRPEAVHRALDAELAAARARGADAPMVLDVGGGSGVWAVPLAALGCRVTVVEPSPNALATLARRAQDAGVSELVTGIQGDTDALAELTGAIPSDLVLAHGILEYVEDPRAALRALAAAAGEYGTVSVLVANRYATVLHRALAGRVTDALRLFDGAPAGADGERAAHRFDTEGLRELFAAAGLEVTLLQGQGVLTDLVPGWVHDADSDTADSLADLELRAAARSPLRDIASRLHALGTRRAR